MTQEYALYIHIPFCRHRCAYCDFNTYAGQEDAIPAYVDALCREIELVARSAGQRLTAGSIFLGGGTPSLLPVSEVDHLLLSLRENFELLNPEISLEANPGTVSPGSLQDLRMLGFNRISFGVQSFHPEELRFLERIHDPSDVFHAVDWARRAGFDNLNLDLIYGLPGQTMARWKTTLRQSIDLHPQHLSLYALTIESGTPLGRWTERGLVQPPDPDLAADMYDAASELLADWGFRQYEISNWSLPEKTCRHNLQYWRNLPYLGFGAGAHGYAGGMRYSNAMRIKTYIDHLLSPPESLTFPLSPAAVSHKPVSIFVEMQDTMMLGLRLTNEGVDKNTFHARFGRHMDDIFGKEINGLITRGLLEWEGEILRLSHKGRLLGNQVFLQFV
jgi:oxygen-independent coproporphyrinogen III oxidase